MATISLDKTDTDTTDDAVDADTTTNSTGDTPQAKPSVTAAIGAKLASLRERPISLQQLIVGLTVLVLIVAVVVLSWQLIAKSDDVSSMEQAQADRAHAEQVALDYATGAAKMDFTNPAEWQQRLVKGTTPELGDRLKKASTSMEQLIKPMQWTSSSEKLTAKVTSVKDGVYQVAAFVSVFTKNVQAPDGIESTATYKMTIDSNNNWVITEISGIPTSLGGDTAAPNAAQPK